MPKYDFVCDTCHQHVVRRLPMAKCSEPFTHTDLEDGETCLGMFRRHLSADFQMCAQPYHLIDENKCAFGMQSGVYSTKDEVEHMKKRDKEYEAKWRPSQNPSPFASSIE